MSMPAWVFGLAGLGAAALTVSCTGEARPAPQSKMILLGVDGMDPDFLERHWDALPNLNRLKQAGDFRRLATTMPPQSPVAWSSVITGMDPGGHGIFDFVHRDAATRMPFSSMAETEEPRRAFEIGPFRIPLEQGKVKVMRSGPVFWELLNREGIAATVIRMPTNFPPVECETQSLSGMGTPDMQGTFGTFAYYTDDPREKRETVPGGRIHRIEVADNRVALPVYGPVNTLRKDKTQTRVELVVHVDPDAAVARFDIDDQRIVLKEGEWSGWFRARFELAPALKSARGTFRVLLRQVRPLKVYVSPINIDPLEPELPIASPDSYSGFLAKRLGLYYTQGIAEETSALRAGVLTQNEFLEQSRTVMTDSLRMFRHHLDQFEKGLLFYYFSSIDQNAHVLWGRYEDKLLEFYQALDGAIGEAIHRAGRDTTLVVMSDHGFSSFDRAVHLNTWLLQQGFLRLTDPGAASEKELFPNVDWSRTQAYALGLNGLYINQRGRESGGNVEPGPETERVLRDISARLTRWRDGAGGRQVVQRVYRPAGIYAGKNIHNAPDLLVGYSRGYRASWQTVLGAIPGQLIEDNTQAWIGDHCMAAEAVPGVLLANRRIRLDDPQLQDVTATVLKEFKVQPPPEMIGRALF